MSKSNSRIRAVDMVEVIKITHFEGAGTEADLNRLVTEYWLPDGKRIAFIDPILDDAD